MTVVEGLRRFRVQLYLDHQGGWYHETFTIQASSQAEAAQDAARRWPHATVIRTTDIEHEERENKERREALEAFMRQRERRAS